MQDRSIRANASLGEVRMTDMSLTALRVLVVEDEYYIADDVRIALTGLGAEVLGPVPSVAEAQALIGTHAAINCVLLDVNLRGELAFDVADLLQQRGIPFAFVTGYDREALPSRFSDVARLEKPVSTEQLTKLLHTLPGAKKFTDAV